MRPGITENRGVFHRSGAIAVVCQNSPDRCGKKTEGDIQSFRISGRIVAYQAGALFDGNRAVTGKDRLLVGRNSHCHCFGIGQTAIVGRVEINIIDTGVTGNGCPGEGTGAIGVVNESRASRQRRGCQYDSAQFRVSCRDTDRDRNALWSTEVVDSRNHRRLVGGDVDRDGNIVGRTAGIGSCEVNRVRAAGLVSGNGGPFKGTGSRIKGGCSRQSTRRKNR